MFNRKVIICFLLLSHLGVFLGNATDDIQKANSSFAKNIYSKAKNNSHKLNYKTVLRDDVDKRVKIDNFFHKVEPDGTVLTRREIILEPLSAQDSLNPYIEIENNAGRFRIIKGDKIIKLNFQWLPSEIDETGLDISYSLSEGNYKGVNCYIITKETKPDNLAYERYIKTLPTSFSPDLYRSIFDRSFRTIDVAYIGKEDYFFRKITSYSIKGNLLGKREYGEVFINPVFDKNSFEIPNTAKIIITNSNQEYVKITSEIIKEEVANQTKTTPKP